MKEQNMISMILETTENGIVALPHLLDAVEEDNYALLFTMLDALVDQGELQFDLIGDDEDQPYLPSYKKVG
ncbi:hypothetical protein IMZ31_20055 (plasmid) [Pontibacillus sp. ALD_SL1]|uniref:hypothetical protein n=1 Tax=Pontibacillus sp. ALD_SL1 TaxID=2777185 RepID=UPI001A95AC66|nr:hypothetical protein [Pontibacillus sp. ALD_SL1]QST02846.1 hypothetical protein IMZ31_20055 [Pontibacillus sp. ALD_SL1]